MLLPVNYSCTVNFAQVWPFLAIAESVIQPFSRPIRHRARKPGRATGKSPRGEAKMAESGGNSSVTATAPDSRSLAAMLSQIFTV
jgi:hypothetical protein